MLASTEAPVRNADREIVLKGLPPCVEVGARRRPLHPMRRRPVRSMTPHPYNTKLPRRKTYSPAFWESLVALGVQPAEAAPALRHYSESEIAEEMTPGAAGGSTSRRGTGASAAAC